MVKGIRMYLEGGVQLKEAFGTFFQELRTKARERRMKWDIIMSGPGNRAFRNFQRALVDHPEAFNILLVDSEGPVTQSPWEHLKNRHGDEWARPQATDSQCHLMVQMMEAWFIADVQALIDYYGKDFNQNAIPGEANVERIEKTRIESALKEATRHTTKKTYHKTRHAPAILERLNPTIVRTAALHCDRLFTTIAEQIEPPNTTVSGAGDTVEPTGSDPA